MDALQLLRSTGRRLAVVMCEDHGVPLVYSLHRVGSPSFLRLAALALANNASAARTADERRNRLLGARTDEDRVRIESELAQGEELRSRQEIEAITTDLSRMQEMQGRLDELVMAAVHAVGIGVDGVTLGLQPVETEPEDICQLIGEGSAAVYLQPVRWGTAGPTQHDIQQVAEGERQQLAVLIAEAFSPTKAASTFRGPRDAGDRSPVGSVVRPKAKRTPSDGRPARGGPRSRGDGSG